MLIANRHYHRVEDIILLFNMKYVYDNILINA